MVVHEANLLWRRQRSIGLGVLGHGVTMCVGLASPVAACFRLFFVNKIQSQKLKLDSPLLDKSGPTLEPKKG